MKLLPAEMPLDAITVLIDTRETQPYEFPVFKTQRATLPTADYSILGLEHVVAIERKASADELAACCGRERDRFDREIQRLLAYPVRALVIEADWTDIEAANWRSRLNSKQVGASLVSWIVRGVPVVMAGNRERAAGIVASMLRRAAIHRYRELRVFANGLGGDV